MKAKSKLKKFLSVISFSAFSFSILSFFAYLIITYNNQVSYNQSQISADFNSGLKIFCSHCRPEYSPLFPLLLILLSGLVFLSLVRIRKLYLAFFFIDFTFFSFAYWFFNLVKGMIENDGAAGLTRYELFFKFANGFDLIAFICISILFFWQISYLLRMLIKTLQRKNKLP